MFKILKLTFIMSVLVFLSILCMSLLLPSKVSADISSAPSCVPQDQPTAVGNDLRSCSSGGKNLFIHLSTNHTSGANGAYLPLSKFKLYSPGAPSAAGREFTIRLSAGCSNNTDIEVTFQRLSTMEGLGTISSPQTKTMSSCSTDYTYMVPSSYFTGPSQVEGHDGLFVVAVQVRLIDHGGNSPDQTVSLHAITSSSTKIGYLKDGVVSLHPGSLSGDDNIIEAPFRPSCSAFKTTSSKSYTIRWSDDDYGTSSSGGPQDKDLPVYLLAYADGSSSPTAVRLDTEQQGRPSAAPVNPSNFSYSGKSYVMGDGHVTVTLSRGYSYALVFNNVHHGNTIAIELPADSGDFDIGGCVYQNVGSLGLCSSTTVHFDVNSNGARVQVYARTSNDGDPFDEPKVYESTYHGAHDSINLGDSVGLDKLHSNYGFWVLVRPLNDSNNPTPSGSSLNASFPADGGHDSQTRNLGTGPCFSASCSVQVVGNIPGYEYLTGNVVANQGGAQAVVRLVNNTGNQLPQQLQINTDSGINYGIADPNGIYPNSSYAVYPTFSTPDTGSYVYNASGWFKGAVWFQIASCNSGYTTYRHYNIDPYADTTGSNSEDPSVVSYATGGRLTEGPTISASYQSWLTKQFVKVDGDHTGSHAYGSPPNDSFSWTNSSPILAGDEYCSNVTINPANGWRGPSGDIGAQSASTSSCFTVVNKPYFKTYGGGVSAGGGFVGAGTGEIVAWTNNVDGTFPFGSGSQLAALANGEITGFASAQGVPAGSTAYLSFANSGGVAVNSGDYSPKLGGNFKASHPSTQLTPKNPTVLAGGSTYGGVTISGNRSVLVNGDVYISDNITYNGGSWSDTDLTKTVPSFVLVATGNIYIAPNVTRLDGVYTSQKVNGAIYTCSKTTGASSFAPRSPRVAADNFFSACKNQLLVRGSFVADKVSLMRTYGSLRDEKPTPTTTPTPKRYTRNTNYCFGENDALTNANCRAAGYTNCIRIDEGYNPGYPFPWWSDNWLCNKPSDGVSMQWTSAGAALGLPKCANWRPNGQDNSGWAWGDNRLCISGSKNISFQNSNQTSIPNAYGEYSRYCVHLFDASDPNTNYGSASSNSGGAWLCEDQIMTDPGSDGAPHANVAVPCSNSSGAIVVDLRTCAAEIFDFSPDIYISNPDVEVSPRSKLRWDAITSLPPIL